jgi:hypothetical protein
LRDLPLLDRISALACSLVFEEPQSAFALLTLIEVAAMLAKHLPEGERASIEAGRSSRAPEAARPATYEDIVVSKYDVIGSTDICRDGRGPIGCVHQLKDGTFLAARRISEHPFYSDVVIDTFVTRDAAVGAVQIGGGVLRNKRGPTLRIAPKSD